MSANGSSTYIYADTKHTSFIACAARFPTLTALAVPVFVPEPLLGTAIGRFCRMIQLHCNRLILLTHLSVYLLSRQCVWLFVAWDNSITSLSLSGELATSCEVWQFTKTFTFIFFIAL